MISWLMLQYRRLAFLGLSLTVLLVTACATRGLDTRELTEAQYISALGQALEAINAKAASQPQRPIEFSANLFYAHEVLIEHIPLPILLRYADALLEAGVQRVDINPGLYPWLNRDEASIAKYDALIAHLRRAGVKIVLNPQYSPTYHRVQDLEQWQRLALPVYAELAKRYQPDIFIVVHEPSTMSARMGSRASPAAWRDFAQEAAMTVKRQSPRTRCGAGGLYWEETYFNAFLTLDVLDVMTLDIYNLSGLKTYNTMILRAQRKGKPVYIEETWRPPYFQKGPQMSLEEISVKGVGRAAFTQLDIQWLDTLSTYASAWGLEAITPFWTPTFFAYVDADGDALDPAYTMRVIQAIAHGERTDTFRAYRDLIKRKSRPHKK